MKIKNNYDFNENCGENMVYFSMKVKFRLKIRRRDG